MLPCMLGTQRPQSTVGACLVCLLDTVHCRKERERQRTLTVRCRRCGSEQADVRYADPQCQRDLVAVANCDHARACLLDLDFQALPRGVVDCEMFRAEITEKTQKLFPTEYAPALLKVQNQCSDHHAPIVVPYTTGIKLLAFALLTCAARRCKLQCVCRFQH
jgi:hypothetical protein